MQSQHSWLKDDASWDIPNILHSHYDSYLSMPFHGILSNQNTHVPYPSYGKTLPGSHAPNPLIISNDKDLLWKTDGHKNLWHWPAETQTQLQVLLTLPNSPFHCPLLCINLLCNVHWQWKMRSMGPQMLMHWHCWLGLTRQHMSCQPIFLRQNHRLTWLVFYATLMTQVKHGVRR